MMKTPMALVLGLTLAALPAAAAAQAVPTPGPDDANVELVERLCSATSADTAEQNACVEAVGATLAEMLAGEGPGEEPSLLDRAQGIIEETQELIGETLEQVGAIDLQAAIDDVIQNARDFELEVDIDLQAAIDDAVAAIDALELPNGEEVQQALEDAVGEALAATEDIDIQAAFDDALAEAQTAIEDADVQAVVDDAVTALESAVEDARAVVAEAQQWVQENVDVVCRSGSISLGTTVGIAVFALTGVEWLGLQSFWATERLTNGICGDFVE